MNFIKAAVKFLPVVILAGLMISEVGRSARPNIQATMMAGTMKYVVVVIVQKAFIGISELVADDMV